MNPSQIILSILSSCLKLIFLSASSALSAVNS